MEKINGALSQDRNNADQVMVPLRDADLPMILRWRNHPDVRRMMFTDHEISLDEHLLWWERTHYDLTKQTLLFYYEGSPVGVVNFFDIDLKQGSCHWGFYIDNFQSVDNIKRLKIWLALERAAIEHVFSALGLKALYCETFELNRAVHQIHRKFGFEELRRVGRNKNGFQENIIEMILLKEVFEKSKVQEIDDRKKEETMKIAFLGSANWDLISRDFIKRYNDIARRPAEIQPIPFGQYRQQLWDDRSDLLVGRSDYYVFCERFEDFFESPFSIFDISQAARLEANFDEYLQQIKHARSRLHGAFFVLDLAPVRPFCSTLEDSVSVPSTVRRLVATLNERLAALCETLTDCYLIRLSALVEQHGARHADPGKYWHMGRLAFNGGFTADLNKLLIKTILAQRGETARVLVVDLDNTLWGGVIGDDGLQGIKVGGDFPGNAFVEIQRTLKALRQMGIALAICSKNTEGVAVEAFAKHPSMVLRMEDFTSIRINWTDKATNIREIAEEIGVGLSSICFLDDSPYEREAIRQMLPEVIVPEMPEDITQWSAFILSHPRLAILRLTNEDRERVERYAIRAKIKVEAASFVNKEDYWRSLGMELTFHRLSSTNLQRVLQLMAKTNQFNMTTRRHSEKDLEQLVAGGGEIIPIGLADKYSDAEIIGLVILVPARNASEVAVIETFLLSCRVLGRSVETGILSWVCEHLKEKGHSILEGLFYETPRNVPASRIYADHGFEDVGGGRYQLNLNEHPVVVPQWFQIIEER